MRESSLRPPTSVLASRGRARGPGLRWRRWPTADAEWVLHWRGWRPELSFLARRVRSIVLVRTLRATEPRSPTQRAHRSPELARARLKHSIPEHKRPGPGNLEARLVVMRAPAPPATSLPRHAAPNPSLTRPRPHTTVFYSVLDRERTVERWKWPRTPGSDQTMRRTLSERPPSLLTLLRILRVRLGGEPRLSVPPPQLRLGDGRPMAHSAGEAVRLGRAPQAVRSDFPLGARTPAPRQTARERVPGLRLLRSALAGRVSGTALEPSSNEGAPTQRPPVLLRSTPARPAAVIAHSAAGAQRVRGRTSQLLSERFTTRVAPTHAGSAAASTLPTGGVLGASRTVGTRGRPQASHEHPRPHLRISTRSSAPPTMNPAPLSVARATRARSPSLRPGRSKTILPGAGLTPRSELRREALRWGGERSEPPMVHFTPHHPPKTASSGALSGARRRAFQRAMGDVREVDQHTPHALTRDAGARARRSSTASTSLRERGDGSGPRSPIVQMNRQSGSSTPASATMVLPRRAPPKHSPEPRRPPTTREATTASAPPTALNTPPPNHTSQRWVAPTQVAPTASITTRTSPQVSAPQVRASLTALLRHDAAGRELLRALLKEVEQLERFERSRRVQ